MSAVFDINIEKASTFSVTAYIKDETETPVDLAECTVYGTLREYPEDNHPIYFTIDTGDEIGRITFSLSAEQTADIGYRYGAYDIFIRYPNNTIDRIISGQANIYSDVTRIEYIQMGVPANIMIISSRDLFPQVGNFRMLYVACDTNMIYRWADDSYVPLVGQNIVVDVPVNREETDDNEDSDLEETESDNA